jgi:lipid-binding SYLF domain-containing protein
MRIRTTIFAAAWALAAGAAAAQEDTAAATDQEETQAVTTGQDETQVVERQLEIDAEAQETLNDLFATVAGSRELFDQAAGYAAFRATKAGFMVTGGGGTGVAVDKTADRRTYMRMGTGGLSLGIGAQRYNLVILFEDSVQLDRFIEGGWDASASAQAAAGTDGVAVNSSFVDGVAFFQLTHRGLMAQADISGTRFWPIDRLN